MSDPRGMVSAMRRFSFLHAADLHLDTPFEGLGGSHPAVAAALRDASLAAWDRLVEEALRRRVAFVLLAGDLYDGPERGLRAQLRFRRGLERLSSAGVEVFVVHGNHDPLEEGWSALRELPAGVHVFGAGEPAVVPVVRGGQQIALVHGVSYRVRAERENLARRFVRAPGEGLQIGLLHAHVEGQAGHDPYAPCVVEDLRASGLDYWALGHVHQRQTLLSGATWAVYPGNLQGRSLKPTECGPKGAVVVHVADAAIERLEFVELAPVRFEWVEVDIGQVADLAALEASLIAAARGGEGNSGVVVRARLVGRGPLHADLLREGDAFLEALREAGSGGSPWIFWERIERATAPPVDLEALRARDDFAGEVLRELALLHASPAAREALAAEVDAELLKGDIARVLGPCGDVGALLHEAEALAIERLGGEA
jgi:DNA repair protein SbcD/Mre11